MDVAELSARGAPPALVDAWRKHIGELTLIQERAVDAGVLNGKTSLLVVAPTSSGKTFIGEIAATTSAYTGLRHAIFIVPFRALAEEHYELFRARYGELLSVVISTSDYGENDADIRMGNFNLAVMTYEKLIGFLVHEPDLLARCTTLVVDEVQTLGEGERGAKLEFLITQVLLAPEPPQLIALSASLDEVDDLNSWLQTRLVISSERPVPLTQIVCDSSGRATFIEEHGEVKHRQLVPAQADHEELLLALVEKFVGNDKQVIVFRSSVKNVHATASRIQGRLPAVGLPQELDERLNALDESDAAIELRHGLAAGVGLHNADLTHAERRVAEQAFRSGQARVLVSTTTLSMGVNLPSDAVIVADSGRFVPMRGGWHKESLSVSEYRNAAGRAGRLGQRDAGVAVLLAENQVEHRQFVDAYLLGRVEAVRSQIAQRPFADVVFTSLCAEVAQDEAGLVEFIAGTLAYRTFYEREGGGLPAVQEGVTRAVAECLETSLIIRDGETLWPTPLGKTLAGAGVSLATAVQVARLSASLAESQLSRSELAFEIASFPEVGDRPWVRGSTAPSAIRGRCSHPKAATAPQAPASHRHWRRTSSAAATRARSSAHGAYSTG